MKIRSNWNFWKDIIIKSDGTVNLAQLKKELSDFSHVLEQVPLVYCHITGSLLSKTNYFAQDVINVADEHYEKLWKETFNTMLADMRNDKVISEKVYNNIIENIEVYL